MERLHALRRSHDPHPHLRPVGHSAPHRDGRHGRPPSRPYLARPGRRSVRGRRFGYTWPFLDASGGGGRADRRHTLGDGQAVRGELPDVSPPGASLARRPGGPAAHHGVRLGAAGSGAGRLLRPCQAGRVHCRLSGANPGRGAPRGRGGCGRDRGAGHGRRRPRGVDGEHAPGAHDRGCGFPNTRAGRGRNC